MSVWQHIHRQIVRQGSGLDGCDEPITAVKFIEVLQLGIMRGPFAIANIRPRRPLVWRMGVGVNHHPLRQLCAYGYCA